MRLESVPENDADPEETREWLEALRAVTASDGLERARYLLRRLEVAARDDDGFTAAQP